MIFACRLFIFWPIWVLKGGKCLSDFTLHSSFPITQISQKINKLQAKMVFLSTTKILPAFPQGNFSPHFTKSLLRLSPAPRFVITPLGLTIKGGWQGEKIQASKLTVRVQQIPYLWRPNSKLRANAGNLTGRINLRLDGSSTATDSAAALSATESLNLRSGRRSDVGEPDRAHNKTDFLKLSYLWFPVRQEQGRSKSAFRRRSFRPWMAGAKTTSGHRVTDTIADTSRGL